MRMTDKDLEILDFLRKWGYGLVDDLMLFGEIGRTAIVWRLKRLVENGIIKREKCVFGKYIYFCDGFKGLNVGGYEHDLMCKKLCKYLIKSIGCDYMTDKELTSEAVKDLGVAGLTKKVPDFVLVKDGKRIAIEVELSQKALKRQEANINKYIELIHKDKYVSVVYYCLTESIRDRINEIAVRKGMQQRISSKIISEGF